MVPVIGSFATSGKYAMKASDIMAKMGTKYTKSSLAKGRKMHKIYKSQNPLIQKEFRKVPGCRPDAVDLKKNIIYELKPYNPRNVTKGINQLNKYKNLYNFYRPVQGGWNTIIEFY